MEIKTYSAGKLSNDNNICAPSW